MARAAGLFGSTNNTHVVCKLRAFVPSIDALAVGVLIAPFFWIAAGMTPPSYAYADHYGRRLIIATRANGVPNNMSEPSSVIRSRHVNASVS